MFGLEKKKLNHIGPISEFLFLINSDDNLKQIIHDSYICIQYPHRHITRIKCTLIMNIKVKIF